MGVGLRPPAASCLRPRGMYIYSVLAALFACGLAALYLLAALGAGCGSSDRGRPGASRRGSREAGGLRLHREGWYRVHIDHEPVGVVFCWTFCLETNNDLARVHVPQIRLVTVDHFAP